MKYRVIIAVRVISNALSNRCGIVLNDNKIDFFVISELTPSPLDNADTVEDFSFKLLNSSITGCSLLLCFFLKNRIINNSDKIIFTDFFITMIS